MSTLDTALMLRLEASLKTFEKQMAKAFKAGTDTAVGLEKQFEVSNKRMGQTAERSAAAIGREMDRLRAKYDPVFAASKKYEIALEELNDAHRKGAIDAATHGRALDQINREYQEANSAVQSHGAEIDRLRTKYDPLYANSRRYEAALSELNRAQQLGAVTAQQYETQLELLNTEYARSAVGAAGLGGGMMSLGKNAKHLRGGIQNVAYQVGDFATQVGSGQAASMALGQQLPQLLGGFGALGAVLGAVVAIGVPLGAAMLRSTRDTIDLEDSMQKLETAVSDYRSAVDSAVIPTKELAEKYGTATQAARDFLGALVEISEYDARLALNRQIEGLTSAYGTFDRTMRRRMGQFGSEVGSEFAETVRQVRDELGAIPKDAEAIVTQLKRLSEAAGPKEVAEEAQRLVQLLEDALGPYEDMSAEAQELYRQTAQAGDEAARLQGAADAASGAIAGAASNAANLADQLARAVENSNALAAASLTDLQRAQIEYEHRADPIARAGAVAGLNYDNDVDLPLAATPGDAQLVHDNRSEVVRQAQEAERIRQQIVAWRNKQSRSSGGSGGSGGGGGRSGGRASGGSAGREEEPFFATSDEELQRLERQMEMIGKTSAEIATLSARYELLEEAKRRGLDLDAQASSSGETLRQQIDAQAQSIGDLTARYEQAQEAADFFEEQQQAVKDAILDAIIEGESFVGTLQNIAKAFARAALEASLFGSGPLSGLFGGGEGLLGGLMSKVPGAGKVSVPSFDGGGGTGNASRSGGLDGRGGFLAMLHPKETVIDHTRGQQGGGGSPSVALTVHNNTGVQAQVETRQSSDGRIDVILRRMVKDEFERGGLDGVMQSKFGLRPRPRGV